MNTRGGASPRPDAGRDPDGELAAAPEPDADAERADAGPDAQRSDSAQPGVRYEPL